MSISLDAFKAIAPPLAKMLLESFEVKSKLKNAVLGREIDAEIEKLLRSPEDEKALSQKVEPIAKQLQRAMQRLFDGEAKNLDGGSQNAIVYGVAETLIKARLTSDSLAQVNFDAAKLKQHLLAVNPQVTRHFSPHETSLYRQTIEVVSQIAIETASQLEDFARSVATATLTQLEGIAQQLQALREQEIQAADEFAIRYRGILLNELDRLEVFGLRRMDRLTSRQSLSMAYITLSVSGTGEVDECDRRLPLALMAQERSHRENQRRSRPIDKALRDRRRFVIRGGAGAGKSTLLQWLAVRAASQNFPAQLHHWNCKIPFFIRLRDWVKKGFPAPEQFPVLLARNFAATMPANWVHGYLDRGQALVLIDGVDELPRQERQDFFEALQDLVRDFSEATYIVTSRPSGLKNLQGEEWLEWEDWIEDRDFVNLTLEPMSAENVSEFVRRWHSAMPGEDPTNGQPVDPMQRAENLQRQLRGRAELRRLASTPLLCAMICALHWERQETLPSARLQLYSECIDMLLNRRDAGRKIPLDTTYPIGLDELQKIELLQSLALKLMRVNRSNLEADRVDSHFQAELKKMNLPPEITGRQIRDLFVDRAALLREPVIGQIDFAHRTFQEYLAAKAALDDDSLEELLQKATDDQWRESIIVAAGLARLKERGWLLNYLIEEGDRQPETKSYLHFLAVACLETATSVEPATRDRVLARAKELLPPKDDDEVAMVARAGHEVVPLLEYESHYSAAEACKCIETLVQLGTNAAMQRLVDYAKVTFESKRDRYSIAPAIGRGWDVFDRDTYLSKVLSHVTILDLRSTQISDVSPLSALSQLQELYFWESQVADISPLSALSQLQKLNLSETQVVDISPLSALSQLQALSLWGTQVTDISPLSALTQLQELYLRGTQVTDIFPLTALTQLQALDLRGTQVANISPLSALSQLQELSLSGTQVADISPLTTLTQLQQLYLSGTQVADISPLSALSQLQQLYLSGTQVTDISPLSALSQLQQLNLSVTQVANISPLSVLSTLQKLYLFKTQVADISALSALTQLRVLDLLKTQVTDISPLSTLTQLQKLNLSRTQVADVSPLKHLPDLTIYTSDEDKIRQWQQIGLRVEKEILFDVV
ncbi:MAG: leucine-rich repeat domain-containing protein [Cyanobacteriota bacterium]|nr:leucine-rich repeat domain-containing protein [Cyanobacteriota bacterium]